MSWFNGVTVTRTVSELAEVTARGIQHGSWPKDLLLYKAAHNETTV